MTDSPGYEPAFLGVPVPLPRPRDGVAVVELTYTHFSVLLRPDRRLAVATAVTIDGDLLRDVDRRGVDWRPDDRVPADAQAGPEVYERNDLDRGHLVRRRDPVWGDAATAARANADTFVYPNAAPQVAAFNQSKDLWLGLEDHVLEHADRTDARLVVLTGPVLADDDPPYRDVRLPRRFWKVAAWHADDGLAATGYVLDQTELLDALLTAEREGTRASAELGAFRTFQVPVAEIAEATGLDLGPLPGADRLVAAVGPRGAGPLELRSYDDVVLRRAR